MQMWRSRAEQVFRTASVFTRAQLALYGDVPWRAEISTEQVRLNNGFMAIPTAPGLGIDINEAAIAKHPYQPTALRHYRGNLVDIRPADAVSYFEQGAAKG